MGGDGGCRPQRWWRSGSSPLFFAHLADERHGVAAEAGTRQGSLPHAFEIFVGHRLRFPRLRFGRRRRERYDGPPVAHDRHDFPRQRLVDETGELFLSLIERIGAHGGLQCLAPIIRGGESLDKRGAPPPWAASPPQAPRKLPPPSSRPRGAPSAPPRFSGRDRPWAVE